MAYTEIHPIYSTLNKAFNYGKSDKKKEERKSDILSAYEYAKRDKIDEEDVYKTVSTGINCTPETAYKVSQYFMSAAKTKNSEVSLSKSGKEIIGWHCTQDFKESPEELDYRIAHEIGVALAKKMFPDFAVIVSTHINTEHIHNHIILGAWNAKGKKHNNNNTFYAKLRKESDMLCEKYDLSVMEDTKQVKLVKWKDEQGKIHYFEPTARKGSFSKNEFANAGDYRNTQSYKKKKEKTIPFKEQIRGAIDRKLPFVDSYEHLIESLRNDGFEILDRTKSGEWRKFITFKAPGQDKGTRDYKLGDGIFYTREALTEYINCKTLVEEENPRKLSLANKDINAFISNMQTKENILYEYLYEDTIEKNEEIKNIYNESINQSESIISNQIMENRHMQYLYDCINDNIKTYQTLQRQEITSLETLISKASQLYQKRNMVGQQLDKVRKILEKEKVIVAVIKKADKLREIIESQEYDEASSDSEKQKDEELLKLYEEFLEGKGLASEEKRKYFIQKFSEFVNTYNGIAANLKNVNEQIEDFNNCIFTLSRIDKEHGSRNVENRKKIEEYQKIRKSAGYERNQRNPGKKNGLIF